MSEKHLTELPWKTLVVKKAIKDLGLQKALVAYAALETTKEPGKALEALKGIAEAAIKLKKNYTAQTDVVEHLEEMLKEVKKITPALEAKVKAAEKPQDKALAKAPDDGLDDEDELAAAEFKKDLKSQMTSALAQVKMRAPDNPDQAQEPKPQLKFMAYIAGKASAVIVSLKVGNATKKLLPDIAGGATGGNFVRGECLFEQNAHTFVLEAVPSGLAKKLSKALLAETGNKYKVRVRSPDGSLILDSDTDEDPDLATTTDNPSAKWQSKLAEWTPAIKVALAAKGQNAVAIAKLFAQATALSKPGGDLGQALAKLAECHALTTAGPEKDKLGEEKAGTSSTAKEKAAQWKARDSKIVPHLKLFLQAGTSDTAAVKKLYTTATAAAGKGDYDGARGLLDQLEPMIVQGGVTGMVAWQKAKLETINQLRQLQAALVMTGRPEGAEIAKQLENVPTGLQIHPDSEETLKALEIYVATDDTITKADLPNPWGIKVSIREPLMKALADLKK